MIFTSEAVRDALARALETFGDRPIGAAAGLTQPNEIVFRGLISEALAYFRNQPAPGEVVLVVAGAPPEAAETWDEARVRAALRERLASGEALKAAAKTVAKAAGWDRRAVYALGVDEKRNTP